MNGHGTCRVGRARPSTPDRTGGPRSIPLHQHSATSSGRRGAALVRAVGGGLAPSSPALRKLASPSPLQQPPSPPTRRPRGAPGGESPPGSGMLTITPPFHLDSPPDLRHPGPPLTALELPVTLSSHEVVFVSGDSSGPPPETGMIQHIRP